MKINITVDMPAPGQGTPAPTPPSLQERVDYAIDQIDCKTPSKKNAIDFLRKLIHKIDALPRPTPEQQHCKKLAQAAVQDYGTYYKE